MKGHFSSITRLTIPIVLVLSIQMPSYAAESEKAAFETAEGLVAELYKANARISEHSEQITDNFVDNCLTVWNRALKVPDVYDLVLKCERDWGVRSPWHHVGGQPKQ